MSAQQEKRRKGREEERERRGGHVIVRIERRSPGGRGVKGGREGR